MGGRQNVSWMSAALSAANEAILRARFALGNFKREQEALQVKRLYAALSASNDAVLRASTSQEMIGTVCESLVTQGQLLGAMIFLHDETTREFCFKGGAGEFRQPMPGLKFSSDPAHSYGHGLGATSFRSGRPCVSTDLENDPRVQHWLPLLRHTGSNACAVFPLFLHHEPAGLIYIFFGGEVGRLSADMMELMERIAGNLSFGLQRFHEIEQRERVQRQNERLLSAINNMSQGIILLDEQGTIISCNDRYKQIYWLLPPEVVEPGRKGRGILEYWQSQGAFTGDIDAYGRELMADVMRDGVHQRVYDYGHCTIRARFEPIGGLGLLALHEDITGEVLREKSFQLMFDSNPVAMFVFDQEALSFLAVNDAALALYGYSREQFLELDATWIRPSEARADLLDQLKRLPATDRDGRDCRHLRSDGTPLDVRLYSQALRYNDKNARMVSVVDMTEQRKAESELRQAAQRIAYIAHHDRLTDLPNRAAFEEYFPSALKEARRDGKYLAVMCMDLDGFKDINDRFGHPVGDTVLREIAGRLRTAAGAGYLARIGGDEFVLLSRVDEDHEPASKLAGRLIDALRIPLDVDGRNLRVGVSLGIALSDVHGVDCHTLLSNADLALSQAKRERRGSARYFSVQLDTQMRERRSLNDDLQEAFARDQFLLHYQPQVNMAREIVAYEALLRWFSPKRGYVSPMDFIPLAEESGLIAPLGNWVLREACRTAAGWSDNITVAVNISPEQIAQNDLPTAVHEILLETGLTPSRLELEITEGVFISDFSRALSVLLRLKSLGVQIAMDDFGTGYSSLSYLQAFPFDRIKIDRAFVTDLGKNNRSDSIVRAVIGLGRSLDIPLLAEGVETEEQFAKLRELGCHGVQGYLFGRPQRFAEIAERGGTVGRVPNSRLK
jgi:diguanylate cyclase (GGDEF)-like protein/PAS domain S-box-containing protein